MVIPFRTFSTKKEAILTSKIDQLIITIGINECDWYLPIWINKCSIWALGKMDNSNPTHCL